MQSKVQPKHGKAGERVDSTCHQASSNGVPADDFSKKMQKLNDLKAVAQEIVRVLETRQHVEGTSNSFALKTDEGGDKA